MLTRHFVPCGGERALRLRSPFWFQMLASAARTPAVTERTLALVPRAKYPHCSARARDGLASLPPLLSLTHLLHRFRRSLPFIPKSANLTRPSMQTAGAPKKKWWPIRHGSRRFAPRAARTVTAFPVLADRARAGDGMAGAARTGRATSSGQKRLRREALPIAEDKSISIAWLRPMRDVSNSRGDGPAFAALRRLRLQNWPTPLGKPN